MSGPRNFLNDPKIPAVPIDRLDPAYQEFNSHI